MPEPPALDESRLIVRRFAIGDLDALETLLNATPETARNPAEVTREALVAQLTWPGHAPTRDRWVVAERSAPDHLLGYCSVFKPPTTSRVDLLGVTHPQARHQGIGSALLRLALADAMALGATDAAMYVNDLDAPVATWIVRRGFAAVGAFTALVASGERAYPLPKWPAGVSIRAWRDAGDLPTLVEASNRCYAGLWGHNVTTEEEWSHWLPELDTRGVFFLYAEERGLIGMARASLRMDGAQTVGTVDAPGVVAEARGEGLYRPLLLHAIQWLAAERPDEITIESWGDDPA
ncbi:MAG TPA: GNAT family N-acetyltransferase, partial [Ktedonobacterales bacterium]|nr:GNAT family N-acetyltransferase [Ktedonobacterales bacterium]